MATKPTQSIEYASSDVVDGVSGKNNAVAPSAGFRTNGIPRISYPVRQHFNWLFRYIWKYVLYFLASFESHVSDTGSVTNENKRIVIASETSQASGEDSAVVASEDCIASGEHSAVIGSDINCEASAQQSTVISSSASDASATHSQVNASDSSEASGLKSQVNASASGIASETHSQVNASTSSNATGSESQVNASASCDADGARSQVNASDDCEASGIESQVNACDVDCIASGSKTQVNASTSNCKAESDNSQVNASSESEAYGTGSYKQINTSVSSVNHGDKSGLSNSIDSTINLGSFNELNNSVLCNQEGNNSLLTASLRTKNDQDDVIVGGTGAANLTPLATAVDNIDPNGAPTSGGLYSGRPQGTTSPVYDIHIDGGATFQWRRIDDIGAGAWTLLVAVDEGNPVVLDNGVTITFPVVGGGWTVGEWSVVIDDEGGGGGANYLANRTWEIDSSNGQMTAAAFNIGAPVDYAEYFENVKNGVIPFGTIVTMSGGKVKKANKSDHVIGIVSARPAVSAGDSPFCWNKRYMTGEFGEWLYDIIPDPDFKGKGRTPKIKVNRQNPDYDGSIKNIPRSDRPKEWSCVGLIGQIHTRVDKDVKEDDFIGGDGSRSDSETRIQCMKIMQSFDEKKKYAVALCHLR